MKNILLTNVSRGQISTLNPTKPVITIRDKYSAPAVIPNEKNRRVLPLCFFASEHLASVSDDDCLSKDDVRNIIELIKLSADEGQDKIYFQCGEGRIRSYTLATDIVNFHRYSDEGIKALKGIDLKYCNKDSVIKKGIEDRDVARRLRNYLEELNEEFQESVDE